MMRSFATAASCAALLVGCAHTSPATPAAAAVAAPPGTPAQVTDVRLAVVPGDHDGPCPVNVELVGTITADGPGVAYYSFQAGALGATLDGSVSFAAAGSQTVKSVGVAAMTPQVQEARFLAGMEPRGHQENAIFVDAPLRIRCSGR